MQSIALNVKCFEQDDKPGYVVEWPSIELCRRRQNQATYPEADGPPYASCSVLLRMGFTCALSVTSQAVVSYTALPPLPTGTKCLSGGIFLLHCPWSRLHQTLSGTLLCEARTFLTPKRCATVCLTCILNKVFIMMWERTKPFPLFCCLLNLVVWKFQYCYLSNTIVFHFVNIKSIAFVFDFQTLFIWLRYSI